MKYRTFARVDEDGEVELDHYGVDGSEYSLVYRYSFEYDDAEWAEMQRDVGTDWFPVEAEL